MEAIVLYPCPGMGHLFSMVELGKLLVHRNPSLFIHILITTPSFEPPTNLPIFAGVPSSIMFHHLPTISLAPKNANILALILELLRLNNPNVRQTLDSITCRGLTKIRAMIVDFFCIPALDIANELKIPCYLFSTSAASCLALFLHLPTIHESTSKSFKDFSDADRVFSVAGLPPLVASDMPQPLQDRTSKEYGYFLEYATKLPELAGFLVNTFEFLEERAIRALVQGLLLPHRASPPVYCIGPLVASDHQNGNHAGVEAEYMRWLDAQPVGSVLFLCFGSLGMLSIKQLKEIAVGLERSGQRFLWVIRNPPSRGGHGKDVVSQALPEGFLERTRNKGMVLDSWAPQITILNHKSVGGFVTHCGWNSILEAICAGVPMIAWPLYAEQRLNKVVLVEELKVALPIVADTEDGVVAGAEVEKRVRELMEPSSKEGRLVREKVMAMRDEARLATADEGSSTAGLIRVTKSWEEITI